MRARGVACGFLILVGLLAPLRGAQETIQKEVTVTLVEVPVRVLLHGQPVRDLGRESFRLFENGVEKDISRFQVVSRRIDGQPAPEPAGRVPRLFLLLFYIYDYNPAIGAAIDEFFRDVFRPGDSVLVVTEDRLLNFERGQGVDGLVAGLKEALVRFKGISTQNTFKIFRELDHESDRLLGTLRSPGGAMMGTSVDQAIVQFLDRYRFAWEIYQKQFMQPDLEFYRLLLKRMQSFEGEKWALCFQQRDLFPTLKNSSELDIAIETWMGSQVDSQDQVKARLVQARREDLRRSFNLGTSFSPDLLSDLFLAANTTFHLVLLKSVRTVASESFELREVGQDFEAMLRRICEATGGHYGFSNRPVDVLREAARKEDYHYVLVYSAQELPADKDRRTEVRVDRAGVDVVYLKRPFRGGSDAVAVSGVTTAGGVLSFSVGPVRMTAAGGRRRGSAGVKLVLYNSATEKVFDEDRTLELTQETAQVSLSLESLGPGDYFLIIEAVDLATGERDVYNGSVRLSF